MNNEQEITDEELENKRWKLTKPSMLVNPLLQWMMVAGTLLAVGYLLMNYE